MTKPWSTSARRWERHSHRRRPCCREPYPRRQNFGRQIPKSAATYPGGGERGRGGKLEGRATNERERGEWPDGRGNGCEWAGEEGNGRREKQNENEKADAEASLRRDKIINSFYVVNKRGPVLQLQHRPLVSYFISSQQRLLRAVLLKPLQTAHVGQMLYAEVLERGLESRAVG